MTMSKHTTVRDLDVELESVWDETCTQKKLIEILQKEFVVDPLEVKESKKVVNHKSVLYDIKRVKISIDIDRCTYVLENGQKMYRKVTVDDVIFDDWPSSITVKEFKARLKIWFMQHQLVVWEENEVVGPNTCLPGLLSAQIRITVSKTSMKNLSNSLMATILAPLPAEDVMKSEKDGEVIEAVLTHGFKEDWIEAINSDPKFNVVIDEETWYKMKDSATFEQSVSPLHFELYNILNRVSNKFEQDVAEEKVLREASDWASTLVGDLDFVNLFRNEKNYPNACMYLLCQIALSSKEKIPQFKWEVSDENLTDKEDADKEEANSSMGADDDVEKPVDLTGNDNDDAQNVHQLITATDDMEKSDDIILSGEDDALDVSVSSEELDSLVAGTGNLSSEEEKDTPDAKRLDQKISPVRD